ncbi:MAG: YbjN domain-containing protein [Geminicoccaceae bacterium]|nr:MAG: YbjN domain-containing protein [Geminicoccaceae bacterium]
MRAVSDREREPPFDQRRRWSWTVLAAALLAAAPAVAEEPFQRLVTGPTVQGWLERQGYGTALDTDPFGDPMIESRTERAFFRIYFFGCETTSEPRRCRSLSFAAGFDTGGRGTLASVNQWNATQRFGQAYLDDDGDPWLELAINAEGGMPEAQFQHWLILWHQSLDRFVTLIDR